MPAKRPLLLTNGPPGAPGPSTNLLLHSTVHIPNICSVQSMPSVLSFCAAYTLWCILTQGPHTYPERRWEPNKFPAKKVWEFCRVWEFENDGFGSESEKWPNRRISSHNLYPMVGGPRRKFTKTELLKFSRKMRDLCLAWKLIKISSRYFFY